MAITADKLKRTGMKRKGLDAIVRDQLTLIDVRLQQASAVYGLNVLAHELPVHLAIPGLDKKTAQRIVYSAVIQSLSARGFVVRILLEPGRTMICLKWDIDLDPEETSAMDRLIRNAQISPKEFDQLRL